MAKKHKKDRKQKVDTEQRDDKARRHHRRKQKRKKKRQMKQDNADRGNQQEDIKQEEQNKQKKKKKKSKKKKKHRYRQKSDSQSSIKQQEEGEGKNKKKLKQKKKQQFCTQQRQEESMLNDDKMQAIDVQTIKYEEGTNSSVSSRVSKKQFISVQDSNSIIQLFSIDAGDYKTLRRQLPHIGQKKIRNHLKNIFQYCLDKITEGVQQNGRNIKDWQNYQKKQIIRQLHRIRSSNRLLSEQNVEFRDIFHEVMRSYNRRDTLIREEKITFLYRKIQAFVRGFNHLNNFRKNHYVPPDQQDETRKPIIQGGYIMQQRAKRTQKKAYQKSRPKIAKIQPDKLILEWEQEEQIAMCKLYIQNINCEFIIENLRAKFGDNDKWKDFQVLTKKIDHIVKLGLNRLQELTFKPYNKEQMMRDDERRARAKRQAKKKAKQQSLKKAFSIQQAQNGSSYKENYSYREMKEGRLIKNPSLLLRQVFAHRSQSFKVKYALVHLLIQKYPQQSQIQGTLKIIKDFTEWAEREEQQGKVTIVRARPPVYDDGTRPKVNSAHDYDEEARSILSFRFGEKEQAAINAGLSMLETVDEGQDDTVVKEETYIDNQQAKYSNHSNNGRLNYGLFGAKICDNHNNTSVKSMSNSLPYRTKLKCKKQEQVKKQQGFIQVYQSSQSQYQGFISTPSSKIKQQ